MPSRLLEAVEGLFFTFIYVEDGQQFRDCQKVLQFLRKIEKLQLTTLFVNRGVAGNQFSDAARIDVADLRQVQQDLLFAFLKQATNRRAQGNAAFADGDLAIHIKNGDISNLALRYV